MILRPHANPAPQLAVVPDRPVQEASRPTGRPHRVDDDCGCALGARCMVAGFVATLLVLALQHGTLTPAFFWRSPLALAVAFLGAGLGKAVGITRARRRQPRVAGRAGSMRLSAREARDRMRPVVLPAFIPPRNHQSPRQ
jgi:hypothetical protein